MSSTIKLARRQQTQDALKHFRSVFTEWLQRRGEQDRHRLQFATQLSALNDEILGALGVLEEQVRNIDSAMATGMFYAICAKSDRTLAWLWGVFEYFRERFDQRDDVELRDMLFAADEVVWSCYKPALSLDVSKDQPEPSPLSCLADGVSPAAVRRDRAPLSLVKDDSEFVPLRQYLDQLPVPVLRLPRGVLCAPWLLILVGHEIGHFVQPMLSAGNSYVKTFREMIEAVVAKVGGTSEQAAAWGQWAPEIFADWYSVLTMGPWATWMMAQFEFCDSTEMRSERDFYPSPLTRLALLAALADGELPGKAAELLAQMEIDPGPQSFAEPVAAAIRASAPGGLGKLGQTLGYRANYYACEGEVERWSRPLLGGADRAPVRELSTARLIAAASGLARWEVMRTDDDATRRRGEAGLLKTARTLRDNAAEGRRSVATTRPVKGGEELLRVIAGLDAETGQLRETADTLSSR